jgi:tRNA threonylcarbamoyladenosine biosynthesis protein TsaE
MAAGVVTLSVESPEAMRRLAARLGKVARPGDVIALIGTLGAGKTCFVQGLAKGLGVPKDERVASPTFNIILEHQGRIPLYHIDLYRLGDPGELAEIGLGEYLGGNGIAAVEWFDRFPEMANDYLEVKIDVVGEKKRAVTITAFGERAEALRMEWIGAPR